MGLRLKFNLSLFLVAGIGISASGYIANNLTQKHAQEETLHTASIIMENAKANRSYTINEIRPLLKNLNQGFTPQMVPAYSAHQNIQLLHKRYPEYTYKEATINPTNPASRANNWETAIIERFQANGSENEVVGERGIDVNRILYLARPIKIENESCLACHSTVENAPPKMLALYGTANGFGWKLNQVVGTQIVKVPMSLPLQRANDEFKTFMYSMIIIFIFTVFILNLLLNAIVINPIRKMSQNAEEVSMGNMDAEEFTVKGNDEVASLAHSMSRMRRSLVSAMKIIDE